MKLSGWLVGILAIIFGILVIVFPDLLKWLVGIFLIVAGALAVLRR